MITKEELHKLIDEMNIREFNIQRFTKEAEIGDFTLSLDITSKEIMKYFECCILPY